MNKMILKVVIALTLVLTLLTPVTAANAANPCLPDKVELDPSQQYIHPGENLKLKFNDGDIPAEGCSATADSGFMMVTYGPKTGDYGSWIRYITPITWGTISYEWLVDLLKLTGITYPIDKESLFGLSWYRSNDSTKLPTTPTFVIGVQLDPTPVPAPTPVVVATPTPTPVAVTKTVAKSQTISCVKGKVTKKISGVKPKCPAGFKKV